MNGGTDAAGRRGGATLPICEHGQPDRAVKSVPRMAARFWRDGRNPASSQRCRRFALSASHETARLFLDLVVGLPMLLRGYSSAHETRPAEIGPKVSAELHSLLQAAGL